MKLWLWLFLSLPAAAADFLIQGAVPSELQPLLAALEHKQEVRLHAWTFWTGEIAGRSVVISLTGMGPINAAAATTLGIEHFAPKAVINQGTAGGQNPDLHVFDIVLGEKTTDYTAFKSNHADTGAGVDPARWTPLFHRLGGVEYHGFPGDPALLAGAAQVKYQRGKLFKGNIGSGFQFNRELDRIAMLRKLYGTDSEDMESAYAAGVAVGMKTPFLAIRILSDTEWSHPTFERAAGEYCAQFVVDFVKKK